ncbi:MAG: Gfo/Idh/MocA family oxidoreductase [Chthoniobacter sp.]
MSRKIRYAMVGGGRGAFIGAVHRIAAHIDGQIELTAGAFSADPEKSRASGADFFLDPARVYGSFEELVTKEAALPADQRIDFVAIVTPNHVHFPAAKAALEHGFHVLSDKPATFDLAEARALAALVKKTGLLYGLTHNYTGYPLVKEARDMIRDGKLGKIRKIVVEYPQGWLATRLEASGQKQASWRTDPKKSGAAGCIGDIGTHAENLAEYMTGLQISELAADLTSFVKGRKLDDDGNLLLRFKAAPKASCIPPRFPSAKRTISTSASTAKKAASNGTRTSRTRCSQNGSTSRCKSCAPATATSAKMPPPPRALHPLTPRATSRPSPTFTKISPAPSAPVSRRRNSPRTTPPTITRKSKTASAAWPSSKPW